MYISTLFTPGPRLCSGPEIVYVHIDILHLSKVGLRNMLFVLKEIWKTWEVDPGGSTHVLSTNHKRPWFANLTTSNVLFYRFLAKFSPTS